MVAFTSADRGEENNLETFFSQELAATKAPEDVVLNRTSQTSLSVSWTPLTLVEARGFPVYRVLLMVRSDRRQARQATVPDPVITNKSFAMIGGLNGNTQYDAVVGVSTGGTQRYTETAILSGNYCNVAL